jgi:hypothetical protein
MWRNNQSRRPISTTKVKHQIAIIVRWLEVQNFDDLQASKSRALLRAPVPRSRKSTSYKNAPPMADMMKAMGGGKQARSAGSAICWAWAGNDPMH